MKYTTSAALVLAALIPALTASAGSIVLVNGGFGQLAGNSQNFGIAICNQGTNALNHAVPVTVSTGEKTVNISSVPSIKAGGCEYSYLAYKDLGMKAGNTYSVVVTIDPQHSVISNTTNKTTYSAVVPAGVASAGSKATANASAQSGNFFAAIWNWIVSLFGKRS
jgi:hypothetical protein